MTLSRIFAVLVGISVMAPLQRGFGFQWHWAFLFGVMAYFLTRYVQYGMRVRREMKADMAEADQAFQRGRQNSNKAP